MSFIYHDLEEGCHTRHPEIRALYDKLRQREWLLAMRDTVGWSTVDDLSEVLDPDLYGVLLVASSLLRIVHSQEKPVPRVSLRRYERTKLSGRELESSQIKSSYYTAYLALLEAEEGDGYAFLQALWRMGESRQSFFSNWLGLLFIEAASSPRLGLNQAHRLKTPYSAWLDALDQLTAGPNINFERVENELRFAALAYIDLEIPWEVAWMSCDVVVARALNPASTKQAIVDAHRELAVFCSPYKHKHDASLRMGRYLAASRSICSLFEYGDELYLNRAVDLITYGWDTYAERHYVKVFKRLQERFVSNSSWTYRPVYALWRSIYRGLALRNFVEYDAVSAKLSEIGNRLDNARMKTALDVFHVDRMLLSGLMEDLDYSRWRATVEKTLATGIEDSTLEEVYKKLHGLAIDLLNATCIDDFRDLARDLDSCRQQMNTVTPPIKEALIFLYAQRSGANIEEPQVELELIGDSLYVSSVEIKSSIPDDMVVVLKMLFERFDRFLDEPLTRLALEQELKSAGFSTSDTRIGSWFKELEDSLGRLTRSGIDLRDIFYSEGKKALSISRKKVAACVWNDKHRDYSGVVEPLVEASREDIGFRMGN